MKDKSVGSKVLSLENWIMGEKHKIRENPPFLRMIKIALIPSDVSLKMPPSFQWGRLAHNELKTKLKVIVFNCNFVLKYILVSRKTINLSLTSVSMRLI